MCFMSNEATSEKFDVVDFAIYGSIVPYGCGNTQLIEKAIGLNCLNQALLVQIAWLYVVDLQQI